MRNMAFHTSICGLLEKHWFMAEFGFVLMMRLKAVFEKLNVAEYVCFRRVYKGFGQTVHFTGYGISKVRVRTVTRIAYVAQNRSALPCNISRYSRSQARTGLTSFILSYHLIINH